jgi:hypothetical protein
MNNSRRGRAAPAHPDSRSHRIQLEGLRQEDLRERLKAVWLDPFSLGPARRSARVTRQIADQLAALAKSLEANNHAPEHVASFLMRTLFTMFSEDVCLLPVRAFTELLQRLKSKPENFAPMLENLWQTMNTGGFLAILETRVMRFNGGLFADASAIPLDRDQLALLVSASEADWRYVEPAIFGTLLERALNPRERRKLGVHYTPRAYVERLVLPTVIEPLRAEWQEVQVAALTYEQQDKHKDAVAEIRTFHHHLCTVRVLDPSCGSGNFLYVTLEHMKRLEEKHAARFAGCARILRTPIAARPRSRRSSRLKAAQIARQAQRSRRSAREPGRKTCANKWLPCVPPFKAGACRSGASPPSSSARRRSRFRPFWSPWKSSGWSSKTTHCTAWRPEEGGSEMPLRRVQLLRHPARSCWVNNASGRHRPDPPHHQLFFAILWGVSSKNSSFPLDFVGS